MTTESPELHPIQPLHGLLPAADFVSTFDEAALLTDRQARVCAFNAIAGECLDLGQPSIGADLVDLLRNLSPAGTRANDAFFDEVRAAHGETMLPIKLEVNGRTVTGTWSIKPVGARENASYQLHRLISSGEEEVDAERMQFLANVTHELRTPLSALVATTELMLEDYQTMPLVELGQMLNLLHRNTRRLESLVSNLLDAAALQSGKLHLRKALCSVDSLVRDASEFVLPLLRSKNQKLEAKSPGTLPAVCVDSRRIVGVLVNLLSNASKYGFPNEPIGLLISVEGAFVRFSVRQKGPEIPQQEQVRLFQRFYRASTSEKVSAGSGLGLAIVKEIVEMHGGAVGLHSKPGKSTAFWFTLPLEGVMT